MTNSQPTTPAAQFASWGSIADQLDRLVCGDEELQAGDASDFDETMPAVCWAVPGAYAALLEC